MMNKILLAMLVGLFAVGAYAADAQKAEVSTAKVAQVKHTAVPAKKAKLHQEEAKKEGTHAAAGK